MFKAWAEKRETSRRDAELDAWFTEAFSYGRCSHSPPLPALGTIGKPLAKPDFLFGDAGDIIEWLVLNREGADERR